MTPICKLYPPAPGPPSSLSLAPAAALFADIAAVKKEPEAAGGGGGAVLTETMEFVRNITVSRRGHLMGGGAEVGWRETGWMARMCVNYGLVSA